MSEERMKMDRNEEYPNDKETQEWMNGSMGTPMKRESKQHRMEACPECDAEHQETVKFWMDKWEKRSDEFYALESENKELRAENERMKNYTHCAYCDFECTLDSDSSVISEHIRTCEKHPIREYENRIKYHKEKDMCRWNDEERKSLETNLERMQSALQKIAEAKVHSGESRKLTDIASLALLPAEGKQTEEKL